jgi:hypothetical protein
VTKTQVPKPLGARADESGRWTGWLIFASIMLCVVGGINLIQGLVALTQDAYFLVRKGDHLLITDFTTWGWILLIWGALQVGAGLGLNSGKGWARMGAIVVAGVSILIQVLFLSAYPVWSLIIIGLDVIVIYALTARWTEAREGL